MLPLICRISVPVCFILACSAVPCLAFTPTNTSSEIENLKQRIEALEAGQKDEPTEKPSFSLPAWSKHLTLGGLLELEANYSAVDGGDNSSDLTLATLALFTDVAINDHIGGHMLLLYEEGETEPIDVDEAVIRLNCPRPVLDQQLFFHGGKTYLPFGGFNSFMISDPLTLELGETNDSAAIFGLAGDLWSLSMGLFNGETDAAGDDDHLDSLAAGLVVTPRPYLSFGVAWISDLAESDNGLVGDADHYSDSVPGGSAFVSAMLGPLALEAEILAALDDFDTALVNLSDLTGKRPLAWNLEAAFLPSPVLQLAARYERADDFRNDLRRYGLAGSYGLFQNTLVALEYLHAEPKGAADSDTLTAQIAFEF